MVIKIGHMLRGAWLIWYPLELNFIDTIKILWHENFIRPICRRQLLRYVYTYKSSSLFEKNKQLSFDLQLIS